MSFIARTQANSTIYKAICQQQSRRFTVIAAQVGLKLYKDCRIILALLMQIVTEKEPC
jgi:hypothetical protein